MSRLQSEWRRLYLPCPPDGALAGADDTSLVDGEGQVRAMVLALARPADWAALSAVWHGVQVDLGLPAPAIAVSGLDGYQLWFSLAEPTPVSQAHAFLESLRARYLRDIPLARIDLLPVVDAQAPQRARHAGVVPAQQARIDQWSAFVAPDLAPVFAETPWLDIPPSPEGQAELLAGLKSIQPTEWQTALARRQPAQLLAKPDQAWPSSETKGAELDPRQFLLKVMNDDTVDLALRIEAAKALLPHVASSGG
jgi:hypothetical protein